MEKAAHLVGVNESHDNDVLPAYNEIIPESKEEMNEKLSFDSPYDDEKSMLQQMDNYDFYEDYELGEVYDLSNEEKVADEKDKKPSTISKRRHNLLHAFTAIGSIVFVLYLFMMLSGEKCSMSQMSH